MSTADALAKAVADAGYEPVVETFAVGVGGMTCASCVAHVEKALRVAPGVVGASAAARAIAKKLGIDEVAAGVLPEGKVAAIKRFAEQGEIAFVGDRVNDAPAVAAANVGLAIGAGADVAIEAADVALMSGDLAKVPATLAISRATLRNIAQNLFWAFGYNAALAPIAAGAL